MKPRLVNLNARIPSSLRLAIRARAKSSGMKIESVITNLLIYALAKDTGTDNNQKEIGREHQS